MSQHTVSVSDSTVDAMNTRARRVFAETLILVKETERLKAADRDKDADRVHSSLAMVAELISTQLGEDIPDTDPHRSDLQDIRDMLWHVDDDGLKQVRAFLSGRVRMTMPPDARSLPPAPSEVRAELGLGAKQDEPLSDALSLGSIKVDGLSFDVDADIHKDGAVDVIVRIGAQRKVR